MSCRFGIETGSGINSNPERLWAFVGDEERIALGLVSLGNTCVFAGLIVGKERVNSSCDEQQNQKLVQTRIL